MNPVIKFTTLFGLLAVEIAVGMTLNYQARLKLDPGAINWSPWIGGFFFLVAVIFVYRSFYHMRIPEEDKAGTDTTLVLPHNVHGDKIPTERQEKVLAESRK